MGTVKKRTITCGKPAVPAIKAAVIKNMSTDDLLPAEEIYKLSNRVKELESAAKKDSEQLDKLIIELQSLLEDKDD